MLVWTSSFCRNVSAANFSKYLGVFGQNKYFSMCSEYVPLRLNNLADNPGAISQKRRVGRGVGSGRGKTCGRGHKGQKARSGGGVPLLFEGGQTPLYRRVPKVGFTNLFRIEREPLNLGKLQMWVQMGRLVPPADRPINLKDLTSCGLINFTKALRNGVKLLAKGKEDFTLPLNLEVMGASKEAIARVEAVGGTVVSTYYNRLGLRALLKPDKFDIIPKRPAPPPKLMPYYLDYERRGYLSPEIQLKILERKRNVHTNM